MFHSVCWILVLCLAGVGAAQNVDPALVGWWSFDEGAGSTAGDMSGESVDAVITGDVEWGQEGAHRGVLLFDGTLDAWEYVFIDGKFNLPVYTIALWFRVDGGAGARDILSAYAPGVDHGILLELQGDGQLRYLHRYPLGLGGGSNIRVATATYDDNSWYHVAMVKSENKITLYINGEEVGSTGDTSEFNPGDTFGIALGILDHERAGNDKRLLPGAIDDVRIYNRPMSAEEIQATMELEIWPYAYGPSPADGALHTDTWANLIWSASPLAVSHDVYLSDNFDDVNDGTANAFQGNQPGTSLVVGFPGFAIPGGLVPGTTYYWRVDEVDESNPDSPWKGSVWSFLVPPKKAYEPVPVDGSKYIDADVELSWTTGYGAKLHTVYFGESFDEVDAATGGAAQGVTTFSPSTLEPGKTYYWRVDEFDVAATHKGDVWSFTVAGTGGGVKGEYFQGQNFNTLALTRTDPQIDFNWGGAPDPAVPEDNFSVRWSGELEAAFTETYTLYTNSDDGVRVWVDGMLIISNWTDHGNTENSGNVDLVAGQIYSVQMEHYDSGGDAVAELLWSSPRTPKQIIPQAAFSLPVRARNPQPLNGIVGVKHTDTLSWVAGDDAASHDVYFGTDGEAVGSADKASPEYKGSKQLGDETFDPGKLAWDTTYYWRVDEVNSANPDSPWPGTVWSFSTGDFLLIEDFEDYNDYPPDEIWNTWIDGFGTTTNGSTAGYASPDFSAGEHYVETVVVLGGAQAMPLLYDNNLKFSEVTMTLVYPTDWTEEGVGNLSLWIRGDSANAIERLYVAVDGAAVYHDNPDVAQTTIWTEWIIPLQAFADQGVDLTKVNTLSIGLGDKNNVTTGGSGVMYIDDIRLYRP
jgi:hypothetical protein